MKRDERSTDETAGDERCAHIWEMKGERRSVQITESRPPACRSGPLGEKFKPKKPGKAHAWRHKEPESPACTPARGGERSGPNAEHWMVGPSVSFPGWPPKHQQSGKIPVQGGISLRTAGIWGFPTKTIRSLFSESTARRLSRYEVLNQPF